MFIAIPKENSHWRKCLVAQSKGQCRRILIQCGYDPADYNIFECVPEEVGESMDNIKQQHQKYFIYTFDSKKIMAIVSSANAVAKNIGVTGDYVRGKFSKTPAKRGVKRITIRDFVIMKTAQ